MERFLKRNEIVLKVLIGGMVTAISITVFAFNTFQTQREADKTEKRLERMENKIDDIKDALLGAPKPNPRKGE